MKSAGHLLLAVALLMFGAWPATAAPAKGNRPATPPAKAHLPLKDPMVFYLARGEADTCGRGCSEWIAAEGAITSGTAARMRAFLKRNPGNRPVYFYSPGGITSESIVMGRLMRQRGITARVARTVPQDCEADAKECAAAKRSGREVTAVLNSFYAQCNSACVYAIVGARLREIAPEAHLGVHASKTVIVGHLPKGVIVPAHLRARFKAENHQLIRRYLADMGVAPALLDAAEKIPHESIRALSRAEMVRFNIDSRKAVEGGWIYDERISKSGATIFKAIDMTDSGSAEYRKVMLRLNCLSADNLLVGYTREVAPKEHSFLPMKIVAANEEFKLAPPVEPVSSEDARRHYDIRRIPVPTRIIISAAAQDRIELAPEAGEGKSTITRLSTVGLASALSSLTRYCGQEALSGGAALVPRQRP